jgi:hypothetical protein
VLGVGLVLAASARAAAVAVGYAGGGGGGAACACRHAESARKQFRRRVGRALSTKNSQRCRLSTRDMGGGTHALPSLMTKVLPALPHDRRSARGEPMNAEPGAAAAWVLGSTLRTGEA